MNPRLRKRLSRSMAVAAFSTYVVGVGSRLLTGDIANSGWALIASLGVLLVYVLVVNA